MTIQNKFLSTLAIGGVLISSASGLMVVNAQTASPAGPESVSMTAKKSQKSGKSGRGAVRTALENQDYEAWKTAVGNTPKGSQILSKVDTPEKFKALAEAKLTVKKAYEDQNKVMTDLGLDEITQKNKGKTGKMGLMHNQSYQKTIKQQ